VLHFSTDVYTELMKDVYQGAKYVNGVPVNEVSEEKAA
jgi:hypothetical protein